MMKMKMKHNMERGKNPGNLQIPLQMFGRSGELNILYKDTPGNALRVQDCAEAVTAEIRRLDCLLSKENPNSEIAELNRFAGKEYIRVGRETMHLLYKAKVRSESLSTARTLSGHLPSHDPLAFLKLMPQGKYGCGYEESMADSLYGGYIGGIAMITKPLEGEGIDISHTAIPYALTQIAGIFKDYGIKNAKLRIGEYSITGSMYAAASTTTSAVTSIATSAAAISSSMQPAQAMMPV